MNAACRTVLLMGVMLVGGYLLVVSFVSRPWWNESPDGAPGNVSTRENKEVPRSQVALPFYTPDLRNDISAEDWIWYDESHNNNIIHIVKTRFMQEQGQFLALGAARLALFRTFCLPTMQQQTTQQFLWIIKTDPDLNGTLLLDLVKLVQATENESYSSFNNTYIVASNTNFRVNENFPGGWRDGAEARDLTNSRIYTGNRQLLEQTMALQGHFPVLETRLDADDGLHRQFLEFVQHDALEQFRPPQQDSDSPSPKWMYWCSRRIIEWHWFDPLQELPSKSFAPDLVKEMHEHGAVKGVQHTHLCITPGITTGFPVSTHESDVPIFAHDELAKKLMADNSNNSAPEALASPDCGKRQTSDCLRFVEGFVFEAIRSRAPTSAGMLGVLAKPEQLHPEWWVNYAFWNMLHESFGLQRPQIRWIQNYLSDHLIEIAQDNLLGQCTTGHSCKDKARVALQELLASRQQQQYLAGNASKTAADAAAAVIVAM